MKKLWRFLFAATDRRTLELLRFALGGLSLLWLLVNIPNWTRDYGLDGMMLYYQTNSGPTWGWSLLEKLPGDEITLLVVGVFLHLSFLIGFAPRTLSLLLWAYHHWLLSVNFAASNSEQFMFRWMFFYGIFLPWGQMWTLPLKKKALSPVVVSWSLRLFQIHVCLIYLISTIAKLIADPAWLRGTALYYVLASPMWSRFPQSGWYAWPFVTEYFTFASLFLEGVFPFVIWSHRLRPLVVGLLLVFHLVLAIVMHHIGFFSLSMMVALLAWTKWQDFEITGNSETRL